MNMPMGSALPSWVTPVAWIYLSLSLVSAVVIAADVYLGRRRQQSSAQELVWVTSALFLGPFALPAYARLGRARTSTASSPTDGPADGPADGSADRPAHGSAGTAPAVFPGASASAVAHIVGVPLVAAAGWTIAGLEMWPMIIVIAVIATALLALYERASSRSRDGSVRVVTTSAAIGVAVVTVATFDIGMVAWMLLLHFNDAMPPVHEGTFWFLMQVGVLAGMVTGYPAARALLRGRQGFAPA